jgi:hypothetical protein
MGKYNFDQLFVGENIDKVKLQNAFLDGIKALRRDAAKNYARLVLAGEPGEATFNQVRNYDDALEALKVDPRMKDLMEWANVENARRHEARVRTLLNESLDRVLGR